MGLLPNTIKQGSLPPEKEKEIDGLKKAEVQKTEYMDRYLVR